MCSDAYEFKSGVLDRDHGVAFGTYDETLNQTGYIIMGLDKIVSAARLQLALNDQSGSLFAGGMCWKWLQATPLGRVTVTSRS